MHRDFAAREQTHTFVFLPQLTNFLEQIVRGFGVIPIITGVIDFHDETLSLCFFASGRDQSGVRQDRPPARADERRVVGFGGFFESMALKQCLH